MFTIGNAARQVGVRPSALRYYEAQGILRPAARRANGYRIYSDDAIKLLLFVRRAQSLGITLREMKGLLSLASQGQRPCERVKELAKSHLKEIDQKIRELQTLQNDLRMLLRRKARRPKADEVCPIIERECRDQQFERFAIKSPRPVHHGTGGVGVGGPYLL